MKDRKLEQQFNEYFDGVEVPANITGDAKQFVKKPAKNNALPRFVKIASIAASFVLCFAIILTLVLRSDFIVNSPNGGADAPASPDDSISSPSDSITSPSDPETAYYGTEELTFAMTDPYTVSGGDSSLKFLESLAFSSNAQITTATASFDDGTTAFIYAEVTFISGVRDDTKIYVEFTDGVYEELKAYYYGEKIEYGGITFYITKEVDEYGEPVSKVFTQKNGVKYYFSVTSSDTDSYIKYLQLIYKNF